jgi:predicted anti-sigma-YlaC factor YlaD
MATEACRDWRGDLAIEALGQLEDRQRAALLAHIDGCAECRAARTELSSVARALDLAGADRIGETDVPLPPQELGDRILDRLQVERVARRRHRTRGFVAAAVGIAATIVVVLALVIGSGSGQHGTVVALHSSDRDVHATAVLYPETSGTRVQLRVDGLDDREWYWLWVTGADGKRVAAGTFSASSERENVTMTAALSLPRAKRVWVTDDHNHLVLDGYLGSTS